MKAEVLPFSIDADRYPNLHKILVDFKIPEFKLEVYTFNNLVNERWKAVFLYLFLSFS